MLFNSIDFAVFLPIVFILYWFVFSSTVRVQNAFITIASYVFYGWWDYRFLALILFSTCVDYFVSLAMNKESELTKRKILLVISLCVNLGLLGFFKYFNFFVDSFADLFTIFGSEFNRTSLNILLPVGISFYTFQTLSYTIDVYKKKLEPTRDFMGFAAFVSFFPQMVAGPIERASNLLPQMLETRSFSRSKASDGCKQILWGLLKKMVIADNCAHYANYYFNNSEDFGGSSLFLGAIFFAFQIYGDFSGYSDIAIGTSRLFGFDLKQNFNYPYFSRDVGEFWRRWHMSLSTWFRDYLYIPLGGSRGGKWFSLRNTFIIFLVSGFWHGANWTFIFWGLINALFFVPLLLMNKNRLHLDTVAAGRKLPSIIEVFKMVSTFIIITFTWIFFRADSLSHATQILSEVFSSSLFSMPEITGKGAFLTIVILLTLFILVEWMGRNSQYAIEDTLMKAPRMVRFSFYSILIFVIGMFMQTSETPFIYFQF